MQAPIFISCTEFQLVINKSRGRIQVYQHAVSKYIFHEKIFNFRHFIA